MKKIIFIVILFALGFCSLSFAQTNQVTLTTYYPAPFGMYQEMRVMGKLGVACTDPQAQLEVRDNDALIHSLTVGRGGGNILSNVAVGSHALANNVSGEANVAIGETALFTNTASFNTAVGNSALRFNTTGRENTALGYSALWTNTAGMYNTATGTDALYLNTTGNNNTATGRNALQHNSTGSYNTASGGDAGFSNTTGNNNTASGYQAFYSNTTGNYNTAVGDSALFDNTTGNYNTAVGKDALRSNTVGAANVAIGYEALKAHIGTRNNTAVGYQSLSANTGAHNTAIGHTSLLNNISGDNNTAIGQETLITNTTGVFNTAIGKGAGQGIDTGSYNTILGAQVGGLPAGLSNTVIIADGEGHQRIYVDSSGNTGIGTTTPGALLHLSNTGPTSLLMDATNNQQFSWLVFRDTASSNTGFVGFVNSNFATANRRGNLDLGTLNAIGSTTLYTNSLERLRVTPAGNVGIKTTLPTQVLDVNGAARIRTGNGGVGNRIVCWKADGTLGYCSGTSSASACTCN